MSKVTARTLSALVALLIGVALIPSLQARVAQANEVWTTYSYGKTYLSDYGTPCKTGAVPGGSGGIGNCYRKVWSSTDAISNPGLAVYVQIDAWNKHYEEWRIGPGTYPDGYQISMSWRDNGWAQTVWAQGHKDVTKGQYLGTSVIPKPTCTAGQAYHTDDIRAATTGAYYTQANFNAFTCPQPNVSP
jgi:hypothetical protein